MLSQFAGSEATEQFIRTINDGFYIQNTSNLDRTGFKSPLMPDNKAKIFKKMDEISSYNSNPT